MLRVCLTFIESIDVLSRTTLERRHILRGSLLGTMEKSDEGKRYVIWFLWKQGKSPTDIHHEMTQVYEDNAPSKTMVVKWVDRFREGWDTVEDMPRSGRPTTSSSTENMKRVREALDEDRRMTVRELEEDLGIPRSSIHRIIHEDLKMTRVVARWVPRLLNENQKQERVRVCHQLLHDYESDPLFLDRIVTGDESWFSYHMPETKQQSTQWRAPGENPPVKAKTSPSGKKRMATVFWDRRGILMIDWLPEGHTINSAYYIDQLNRLRVEIKNQRRGKLTHGILLLHDNARPHTSHETEAAIKELGFRVLPHPAYSPDLAPSDFHLFSKMKEPLRGKSYGSLSALASAINQWVKVTPTQFFADGIESLPKRWTKCVSVKGTYIEKSDDE
jgi:histone-lysine N-methyltransferase SETMAR